MRQVDEMVRERMGERKRFCFLFFLDVGGSMRRKQKKEEGGGGEKGRQGETVLPQGASSHPSEGGVGLFHDCALVF